jgi:hypothetical protein
MATSISSWDICTLSLFEITVPLCKLRKRFELGSVVLSLAPARRFALSCAPMGLGEFSLTAILGCETLGRDFPTWLNRSQIAA